MNIKDRIDALEGNINIKNFHIEEELNALISRIPSSAEFDRRTGTMLKEYFEPENVEEKDYCRRQVNSFINNLIIDYRDCITLIYGELEAYIKTHIDNLRKINKKDYEGRGEIYIMLQYLIKKNKANLDKLDIKLIEFIDNEIRPERNSLTHELLNLDNQKLAEEILNCGDITEALWYMKEENRCIKHRILNIGKHFLDIVDSKIV